MQVLGRCGARIICAWMVFLIAATLWQVAGYGQVRPNSGLEVRGEVLDGNPGGSLRVSLSNIINAGPPLSVDVGPDGNFAFAYVSRGTYLLQVRNLEGNAIYESQVTIGGAHNYLSVRLPAAKVARPASGPVSVRELQRTVAPRARNEQEKGVQAFQNKNFEKAVSHFRKAIGFDPSFAEAYNMLGAAFHSLGQLDEAARQFRMAVDLDPHSGPFAVNLANVMAGLKQFPESEASARAALAADRNLKQAHFLLGYSRYRQAKYDQETIDNLQWAGIEYPKARIYAAEVLRQLGRRSEAAAELQAYLKSSDEGVDRDRVQAWLSQLTDPVGRQP